MEVNNIFNEIRGKLGFGVMRMPLAGPGDADVDYDAVSGLVDQFLAAGFNYFDTARSYHEGNSEVAVRKCLAERHDRSEFILTDKLTDSYFETEADIEALFEDQLKVCGVEYFDFYLLHSLNSKLISKYEDCNAFELCRKYKEAGRIRHFGISFHDKADLLDKILTDHPEIEVVQIQYNYVDYDDACVQSKACYDVCVKHGKPVLVMEPNKGGRLAGDLPEGAMLAFGRGEGSPASYAIRFAASAENVFMVLSGMGSSEFVADNTGYMSDFRPLDEKELEIVKEAAAAFKGQPVIPCTNCRYCVKGCPAGILIPDAFACYNKKKVFGSWNEDYYYSNTVVRGHGKAGDCISCGACEDICPQHLEIRRYLGDVASEFER